MRIRNKSVHLTYLILLTIALLVACREPSWNQLSSSQLDLEHPINVSRLEIHDHENDIYVELEDNSVESNSIGAIAKISSHSDSHVVGTDSFVTSDLVIAANDSFYAVSDSGLVRHFNGQAWIELAKPEYERFWFARNFKLLYNPERSILYLYWEAIEHEDQLFDVYIRQLVEEQWRPIDNKDSSAEMISNPGKLSWNATAILTQEGIPIVAYEEAYRKSDNSGNENFNIFVKMWNGETWTGVGDKLAEDGDIIAASGDSHSPQIALSSEGIIYLAWIDDLNGNSEIFILQFAKNEWQEVVPGSASNAAINHASASFGHAEFDIALDPNNTLYVVWTSGNFDQAIPAKVHTRILQGNRWEMIQRDLITGEDFPADVMAILRPRLHVAEDNDIYAAWVSLRSHARVIPESIRVYFPKFYWPQITYQEEYYSDNYLEIFRYGN